MRACQRPHLAKFSLRQAPGGIDGERDWVGDAQNQIGNGMTSLVMADALPDRER